jgi:hypothetical protein
MFGSIEEHSIQPASGYYGSVWPESGAIPQSFSAGGWTVDSRGFVQQTFLGASIRNFNMQGGFGDTSSQLTVELVNDEFNKSDGTPAGTGDDVYHSGVSDFFAPPIVGSPVFFKFGRNLATVEEAYKQTFDDLYGLDTISATAETGDGDEGDGPVGDDGSVRTTSAPSSPLDPTTAGSYDINNFTSLQDGQYVDLVNNNIQDYSEILNSSDRGRQHLVFGGILQSYIQNRGPNGNPLYAVQVTDPREILANTVLILNNYTGTTFNNNNIYNLFGFLEYNPTSEALKEIDDFYSSANSGILTKYVNPDGSVLFSGVNPFDNSICPSGYGMDEYFYTPESAPTPNPLALPDRFPITGTGFSRRSKQGIPYYRIKQALRALFKFDGKLPEEYEEKGFGGFINFRGFHYVVDLSGLPKMPNFYYLDFDKINMLDLFLEISDVTSKDLFVTLLPVINHPSCAFLYQWNKDKIKKNDKEKLVAGIIRIDTIDRSKQPKYGAIKKFIDGLASSGIFVENQDVGYELSNITTDKFIVGAQEVDMYYFSTNADRDTLDIKKEKAGDDSISTNLGTQWKLETSLEQQVLPYYGKLGKHAVTIPKGFGSYQQILLDSSHVNANGVGNYYVATEIELRCALISYDRWKEFLKGYNDIYLESVEENDELEMMKLDSSPIDGLPIHPTISNNYAVTVPRSVFQSDDEDNPYGEDGLPKSPCNPPYGYPLYYKRATKIGILEAGYLDLKLKYTSILTNIAKIRSSIDPAKVKILLNSIWSDLRNQAEDNRITDLEIELLKFIEDALLNIENDKIEDILGFIDDKVSTIAAQVISTFPRLERKSIENSMRVYNFVRGIADDCLGKKFLVKIPKQVNLYHRRKISYKDNNEDIGEYEFGPFGFKARPISSGVGYEQSTMFYREKKADRANLKEDTDHRFKYFLSNKNIDDNREILSKYPGALQVNYNPISDQYDFNYEPVEHGGFFDFDLFSNLIPQTQIELLKESGYTNLPLAVQQKVVPQDLTNFLNDNGRICPYVRFDDSQYLALDSVGKEYLTQETVEGTTLIPDIAEELDNLSAEANKFHKFPSANSDDDTTDVRRVAFVKCFIDDKFYMPPKTIERSSYKVYGREVKDIGRLSKPKRFRDPATGRLVDSIPYYLAHYVPDSVADSGGHTITSKILDFKRRSDVYTTTTSSSEESRIQPSGTILCGMDDIDTDNVYALITLPGRILPIKDARFKDGAFQTLNTEQLKHYLTMDVVKDVEGFDVPVFINKPSSGILACDPPDLEKNAREAYNKAVGNLSFAFPQQVNYIFPSPVYPDLVALPLLSKERCYGPWISSQSEKTDTAAYANIGGRIDFNKNENLSPWNYGGYYAMNEAGLLEAEFSNSLLLFSERGGFIVPAEPSGVSLGKALLNNGPLVTNITVDISENGIKSTYQLDLYTASFGKLQKQKEEEISKMSRERQKLKDEKNALIRKGLGKYQTSENYKILYENLDIASKTIEAGTSIIGEIQQRSSPPPTQIVATVNTDKQENYSSDLGESVHQKVYGVDMAMQPTSSVGIAAQNFPTQSQAAKNYYNSAGGPISDIQTPASLDFYHPNMSYINATFIKAKQKLYKSEDDTGTTISDEDITLYEA